jgi:integrase
VIRRQLANGIDPIQAKRAAEAAEQAPRYTFGTFADALVNEIEGGFRNAKHVAQWRMTLTTYCAPIRDKALDAITTDDVLAVLRPIWSTKAETASRLRGRIERVLDAARAHGLRSGENPARWRGHLDHLLPKRQKLTRGHHAAMPYREVRAFIERLHRTGSVSALALEFLILAASRTGEVLGGRWNEIDFENRVWTIPATRMKAGRAHRVPLTSRMLSILDRVRPFGDGLQSYIFPGRDVGKPLSNMALEMHLRRMKLEVTVHGFRSSFRDWAAEETTFAREVAEAALAHVVGDMTERAYRRGDALERRRELAEAWASYIMPPSHSAQTDDYDTQTPVSNPVAGSAT